jgi:hypothetical protein
MAVHTIKTAVMHGPLVNFRTDTHEFRIRGADADSPGHSTTQWGGPKGRYQNALVVSNFRMDTLMMLKFDGLVRDPCLNEAHSGSVRTFQGVDLIFQAGGPRKLKRGGWWENPFHKHSVDPKMLRGSILSPHYERMVVELKFGRLILDRSLKSDAFSYFSYAKMQIQLGVEERVTVF